MRFFWAFTFVIFTSVLYGQDPVTWTSSIEHVSGDEYDLVFRADIQSGWNVYSQFIEEGGPVPTMITYETEGLEKVGESTETGYKKEGMDPIFEMNVIKFLGKEPYIIKQRVKKGSLDKVSGYLTYMTCDDERCLPPTDIDFSLTFPTKVTAPAPEDRAAVTDTPQSAPQSTPIKSTEKKKLVQKADPKGTGLSNIASSSIDWKVVKDDKRPVTWSYGIRQLSEDDYELLYKADIEPGWNVYSQFIEEGGPFPTTIYYDSQEGVQLIGEATEDGKRKEGMDPVFEMNVIKFYPAKPYLISQKVKVTDSSKPLAGVLTYMTCNDEKCLPPTDVEFAFDMAKGSALAVGGAEDVSALPTGSVATATSSGAAIVGNVIDQVRPKLKKTYADPLADCGEVSTSNSSMLLMFLFGFGGGLLALLTPCVFPMIPLTVSFFTKDTKRKGWMNGLLYGASIVVIYVGIGLLITGFFGEEALNALSTNWIANTLFFLIFVFFAFSFFGFYEITLPSSWTNKSAQMEDKGGLLGIFFMAFTLALVSFSCTGPIIGAALVESASNRVGPFVVMLGFSLALALPFGLFAAFPAWLNSLPKSGGWMNSVKVVLGFIELALAFKFLTVADLTSHWGVLKYELFLGIWILIALAMAAYGMGWIKFPHDSPVQRMSTRRWIFSFGSLALAVYLASGFMINPKTNQYRSLGLLSGVAPPVSYNMLLGAPKVDTDLKTKYPSYGKCANNIDCFKDYFEGLAYAQEVGKPMLLDHTGHGCVNCRRTEDNIWSDDQIRGMLNDDFVLVSLYVDDRKPLEPMLISKANNKKLRTVGSQWADFEIANFSQISQPLYVMVTPEEEVIATPRGYKEGIQGYKDYLQCGLKSYGAL